jgi:hypothetical protein
MMTAEELISKLQTLPPKSEVRISGDVYMVRSLTNKIKINGPVIEVSFINGIVLLKF